MNDDDDKFLQDIVARQKAANDANARRKAGEEEERRQEREEKHQMQSHWESLLRKIRQDVTKINDGLKDAGLSLAIKAESEKVPNDKPASNIKIDGLVITLNKSGKSVSFQELMFDVLWDGSIIISRTLERGKVDKLSEFKVLEADATMFHRTILNFIDKCVP